MDLFRRVESSMYYRIVKVFDVFMAALALVSLWSYTRRLVDGLVPLGPIQAALLFLLPLWVACFFLWRVKGWCLDQYLSVPGLAGVFSKVEVRALLSGEDFACPEAFRGTYYEEYRKLYASGEWLCVCNQFFHKRMIASAIAVYRNGPGIVPGWDLFVTLYTGECIRVSLGSADAIGESWRDLVGFIRSEVGGFLLDDYIYMRDNKKTRRMLREEMGKQPDPKRWLLSGAAIEHFKEVLGDEIRARVDEAREDARLDEIRRRKAEKRERQRMRRRYGS